MHTLLAFVVPFCLSTIFIPIVKKISIKTEAWAKQNERTIHHGIISRIGGIAIFAAFSIGLALFFKPDRSIQGIYLASAMMFMVGLWDDFLDLPAKFKFLLQVICALILLVFGVRVDTLRVLGIPITNTMITSIFTILWVVGITNAINFLDGLDGLCGGMILVVLSVVCSISLVDRRGDIVTLSLIMMGSILGFLLYNSHPASIFMGDCGSLFLGCMIASISLLGFKSSTMMTLSFPILILILPIVDTFSAILRRKIKNIPFDQADRSHLHHQLMARFGQTTSVLIMCGITFGFGMSAFLYIHNRKAGILLMAMLIMGVELFIERTGMISPSFHPVHSVFRWLFKPFLKNRPAWYEDEDEMEVEITQPKKRRFHSAPTDGLDPLDDESRETHTATIEYHDDSDDLHQSDLYAQDSQSYTDVENPAVPEKKEPAQAAKNPENLEEFLSSFTVSPEEWMELEKFKKRPPADFFNEPAWKAHPMTILQNMHLAKAAQTNSDSASDSESTPSDEGFMDSIPSLDEEQNVLSRLTSMENRQPQVFTPHLFEFDEHGIIEADDLFDDIEDDDSYTSGPMGIFDAIDSVKRSNVTSTSLSDARDDIDADSEDEQFVSALSAFAIDTDSDDTDTTDTSKSN